MNKILFAAPAPYFALHQRHQAFAELLAEKGFSVFYLNPVKSNGFSLQISRAQKSLRLIELKLPFRAANRPWAQKITTWLAKILLQRKLKLDFSKMLLWIAEPSFADLTKENFEAVFYDRCDLHGSFPGQSKEAWQHYERILFEKADLIGVSHENLLADMTKKQSSKSVIVGNACNSNIEPASTIQQRIEKLNLQPGVRIEALSSGAHNEWIDSDWLRMISQHPQIRLHIAGTGRGKGFKTLIDSETVVYHGQLTQQQLFELQKKCDIGLLPFKNIELASAVDPIKAYEYAAAGLMIYSSPVKAFESNPMIDRFIANEEELSRSLHLLANDLAAKTDVSVPRWSDRLETILDRLTRLSSD
jgi:hypothetical protein